MMQTFEDLVRGLGEAVTSGDLTRLADSLATAATAGLFALQPLTGRQAILGFLRRMRTCAAWEMHVLKAVTEGDVVVAETLHIFIPKQGGPYSVRSIAVFEIRSDAVSTWHEHPDLSEVSSDQLERWRRLRSGRW